MGGLEVAEIRLVLVKTPKLRLVPWGCGSRARTVALGIAHRSVGLLWKATWERERIKSGHPVAPRLSAVGQSRREHSPTNKIGVCSPSPNLAPLAPAESGGERAAQTLGTAALYSSAL